jgi:hypothetical protein
MLHVTEEFLFPGGFIEWYAEFRPPKTKGISASYLVWINTLMIGLCVLPLYFGENDNGVTIWYSVAAIAAINACYHIIGTFSLKKYSPGLVTGIVLYIPLFVIGCWHLLSSGNISWTTAIIYPCAAVGYHIFSFIRQGK